VLLGSHDVLLITFDTLRYDVAAELAESGELPFLGSILPGGRWERRHTPANFTYAAHHAFFAGFFPTPVAPGPHSRPFAVAFPGSETVGEETCVFDAPTIVEGFTAAGYHTLCIGGVGFFNRRSALGRVLPGMFAESHWCPEFGVTDPDSTANQIRFACERLADLPPDRRVFLFLNVAALHQPNRFYVPGAAEDTRATHAAALRYVDGQLPPLFAALRARAPLGAFLFSDHGTSYGEDGYRGHRHNHVTVGEVPYAELVLSSLAPGAHR
jgi:hypothetical protein